MKKFKIYICAFGISENEKKEKFLVQFFERIVMRQEKNRLEIGNRKKLVHLYFLARRHGLLQT